MSRVIIVIGGGNEGGISHAVVRHQVAAGDSVAIVDIDGAGARRTAESLAGAAGTAAAFDCDVSDPEAVAATIATVGDQLGPTWGLVYCPAWAANIPAEEMDVESWRRSLDVCLSGALWCAQAVFPQMKANGGGRIVNFGSEASDRPAPGNSISYLAAKGGVRSLTRGLAAEWGRHLITVNTIWPMAATPGYREYMKTRTADTQAQVAANALERMGEPDEDVAPIVEFVLSDASHYLTGMTFPANGGRSMP